MLRLYNRVFLPAGGGRLENKINKKKENIEGKKMVLLFLSSLRNYLEASPRRLLMLKKFWELTSLVVTPFFPMKFFLTKEKEEKIFAVFVRSPLKWEELQTHIAQTQTDTYTSE